MPLKFAALLVAGALTSGVTVAGHHSLDAQYRVREHQRIEGIVVRLVYRNPHSFVYVQTPGRPGEPRVWAVECGTPRQIGHPESDARLKPGDFVVITGKPGRDAAMARLLMTEIVRPGDGRRWSGLLR